MLKCDKEFYPRYEEVLSLLGILHYHLKKKKTGQNRELVENLYEVHSLP